MTELMSSPRTAGVDIDDARPAGRLDRTPHVVMLVGDLDLASRASAVRACTPGEHPDVVVDLSGVMFMDCAGYGALVDATSILRRRGGTMTLRGPEGGPRRLLTLIGERSGLCAPLHDRARPAPR